MNHAAFFDLDGTLLNSIGDLRTAVNETRAHYGQGPLALESVREYIGDGVKLLVERALAGVPHDPEEAVKIQLANYGKHWIDTTCLYPGVKAGLQQLHDAGWKIGIVTNKPEAAVEKILRHLGIWELMDAVAGGEGAYPLKPDPAGCLALLERLQVRQENAAMAGDHYTDLEVGRRAGMKRILVKWGFGNPRSETWDFAAPDFPALTAWLLKQGGMKNG